MGYREYSRYLSFHFPFTHERSLLEHLRACPWKYDQRLFKVLAHAPDGNGSFHGQHWSVDFHALLLQLLQALAVAHWITSACPQFGLVILAALLCRSHNFERKMSLCVRVCLRVRACVCVCN